MGAQVSQTDYEWVYTEEPHATRRKEILGKTVSMKICRRFSFFIQYKLQ